MPCNSCGKSFSILRKEKGCPGCGFSYCSNCLSNKCFITKLNAEAKVCAKCKKQICDSNDSKAMISPPDAYYRRVAAMNEKQDKDNVQQDPNDQQIFERLQKLKEDRKPVHTSTDDAIRERLKKIKGEDLPTTSDEEIQTRLAKLRGLPTDSVATNKVILPTVDKRTEQEQADDLMKQYMEQTNIDTKYKDTFDGLINDMEQRMQKLKGSNSSSSQGQTPGKSYDNIESEDEEDAVRKIVEKIKAEANLDDDEMPSPTNDELPFCEICNEDATMRCLGCKYLFCKTCFAEHKDDDDGCNRYESYQAPKK